MPVDDSQRRKLTWSSGSTFEHIGGYNRVVRCGPFVFVSGTTGYDYRTMTISSGLEDQVRQTVANVREALSQVGASLSDVVRINWVVVDSADFSVAGRILSEELNECAVAATTLVCQLIDPKMRFEMEVTALVNCR